MHHHQHRQRDTDALVHRQAAKARLVEHQKARQQPGVNPECERSSPQP